MPGQASPPPAQENLHLAPPPHQPANGAVDENDGADDGNDDDDDDGDDGADDLENLHLTNLPTVLLIRMITRKRTLLCIINTPSVLKDNSLLAGNPSPSRPARRRNPGSPSGSPY